MSITNIAKTVGITLVNGAASGFIGSLSSRLVGLKVQRDKKRLKNLPEAFQDAGEKNDISNHMKTGFIGGLIGSSFQPASKHFATRIIMSLIGGCLLSGACSS